MADQVPARIFRLVLLGEHLLINREKFLALDVHERRGHDNEFPGEIEVELLHQVNVLAELIGQPDHVHLIDINLFLTNKVQEQIQRPLEHFKMVSQLAHLPAERDLRMGTA